MLINNTNLLCAYAHLATWSVAMYSVSSIWFDCYYKTLNFIGEQMFVVYQHNINVSWKKKKKKKRHKRKSVYVYTRSYLYRVNWMVRNGQ